MSRRPRPWPWGLVEKNGVKRFFAIAIRIPDVRRLPIAFPQDTESSRMGGSRVLTSYCQRNFSIVSFWTHSCSIVFGFLLLDYDLSADSTSHLLLDGGTYDD